MGAQERAGAGIALIVVGCYAAREEWRSGRSGVGKVMIMIVKMSRRGTITLPREVRKDLGDAGIFEVERRSDGVIELRPQVAEDASQRWYWTDRWQQMEREADASIAAGRVTHFEDADAFLADLDAACDPS
jgi:bifunctional DNA-binding transcriptional regulator/antitoxin component of YhaV-PrlF toxin-antitoxin module